MRTAPAIHVPLWDAGLGVPRDDDFRRVFERV
jgi:hypothetical protein